MKELKELIYFYFPWNHEKTYGFTIISEEMEVNPLNAVLPSCRNQSIPLI